MCRVIQDDFCKAHVEAFVSHVRGLACRSYHSTDHGPGCRLLVN